MGFAVQLRDVAVFIGLDARDIGQNMRNAKFFNTVIAQETGELAGIKMIGVIGDRPKFRRGDLLRRQVLCADRWLIADGIGEAQAL